MLERLPPAQRRLVVLTGVAAVLAGTLVAVLVVLTAGRPAVRPGGYEPFEVGEASRVAQLAAARPLFFADPTGGSRGFALAVVEGELVALHVVPPGGSRACPIDWDSGARRFEDCRGRPWRADELRRFRVIVREEAASERVLVDLRRILDPPCPGRPC